MSSRTFVVGVGMTRFEKMTRTSMTGSAGEGARVALQHNLGLGGACVVTLYRAGLADGEA
jgi:hypothetical protein